MKWQFEKKLPVQLAIIEMTDTAVTQHQGAFEQLMACAETYRKNFGDSPVRDIPGIQAARTFFRAMGVDPTKRRPSSEALLQRALKNKPLYSVNTLVDVGNWCSLDFLLPICAYDAQSLVGDVIIRQGRKQDSYVALNHREVSLHQRYLLADTQGPFGSPMTDSQRTAVTLVTQDVMLGIWAPQNYEWRKLRQQADIFADRVQTACGGKIQDVEMLIGHPVEGASHE